MMVEILLSVIGYVLAGLVTARQVKFALEASTDRTNEYKRRQKAECSEAEHGHRYCSHRSTETYQQDWEGFYVGLPVAGGVLWPLVIPAAAVVMLVRFAWRHTESGWRWFFQNPKHRKQTQIEVASW